MGEDVKAGPSRKGVFGLTRSRGEGAYKTIATMKIDPRVI